MSESLFSPSWYRIADLKPRLRGHARIHRHEYRGDIWYVLQDHLAGRYHRFSPVAHHFIGLMDGDRSVQNIWDLASAQLGADAPNQEEVIRLLAQLHAADVLQSDVQPDALELFRRHKTQQRMKWKQRLLSPLALRFALFDPERVLQRFLPIVRPFFSWFGLMLWLVVVGTGAVLTAVHWTELTENIVDNVLAPQNLLLLWLVYPLVKAVHEFGHGFATKVWGGEVHEMGVMLLVFMPVPYVDASAASAFEERYKRMLVGAIGIMVELFLAALALFVWLNAEYGLVRSLAYNVMLIGGVSTLFFNGNPLLRFDGYYVLADALEMPNLARRSNQYIGYLLQRYLFAEAQAESTATSPGEGKWLVAYAISSFVYRIFIVFAITLFIAGKFFTIGILLALWALATMVVMPFVKVLKFLFKSPRLQRKRTRAVTLSGIFVGALGLFLFLVPVPLWTLAEGVIWLPEQAVVRAGTDCFVREYLVSPDSVVQESTPLIRCEDPLLEVRAKKLDARFRELEILYAAQWRRDRVGAGITREEMKLVQGDLVDTRERLQHLIILSPAEGQFVVPRDSDLLDRFLRQGQTIGYVLGPALNTVRVVVPQSSIGLVRSQTRHLEARLANRLTQRLPAVIQREVPGGTYRLPSRVLGSAGGGPIAVDPRDGKGTKTFERVFEYDVTLPARQQSAPVGTRVFVRFDHGPEPLAQQWYRTLRQVFLGRFGV